MQKMKQARNGILRETESSSPNPSSSCSAMKHKSCPSIRKQKWSKENAPPSDLNSMGSSPATARMKSPLPPRPPPSSNSNSNPLKRKLSMDPPDNNASSSSSDSGVKVIVRVRPPHQDEEQGDDNAIIVQKTSPHSLSILGHTFTFDSVADSHSAQLDIFHLVGAPLVDNCLAGFNSSVFAYGQTGSGKTYTIWGPANALLQQNLSNHQQGLTPRVFQHLFSRINEEQNKHAHQQLTYHCRCSFLEIYNEQITDLLDPTRGNLQIREDVKTGVYVENLTEECVATMKDVTQLLLKGLSNRRTGATSINAESSRSHSVFTCVVESRCKNVADGLSCIKTSRINLVDLAGSERQKLTGAAGERLKEAGNINRSLSQLGNLINILAEVSQTGKQRHIPYRDSKLTFLLQESLGGNAKLAMVCAISPAQSCKSETLSTLRFAQRAKAIKNKAIVNEEMQDDVNVLRDVIRQLKDELLRMKANGNQIDTNGGYSTGWNARRSLNLLKFSLNRPMVLPHLDDDGDEEMEIIEEAEKPQPHISESAYIEEQFSEDTDINMEEEISEKVDEHETSIVHCGEPRMDTPSCLKVDVKNKGNCEENLIHSLIQTLEDSLGQPSEENLSSASNLLNAESPKCQILEAVSQDSADLAGPSSLSIVPCDISPVLKSPAPSVSPRVNTSSRKSLRITSMLTASEIDLRDGAKPSKGICLNARKSSFQSSEHLAASLHRGLEIIDSHQHSSALRRSSFRFSYKPTDIKPILQVHKVNAGVQTLLQDDELAEEDSSVFLCRKCRRRNSEEELKDTNDVSNLQLVPVDQSPAADKSMNLVPKAVEKVLAGAIRREMAFEEFCAKQTSEIMYLNRLVQQYKHERECNSIIGKTREDKIIRLESLMDGILSIEEFMEDELVSLKNEFMLLKEKYENHPEVLGAKIELLRARDELERYRNFFDMGERDILLEEIQDLRSQLHYYVDSSPKSARKKNPILQLTYSREAIVDPTLSTIPESTGESAEQKLESERTRWAEAESEWISLTEELRSELEASRSLAEKQRRELDMEKKCSEELKEAMQMAMEGHARMLEQFVDLEEKHIQMLVRHRQIRDGIEDVKKAALKAGVRGAESKFINSLAAEISALKVEREKERIYLKDENKVLQAQLRDTAEAVQAAGELLVRLKEAEEAVVAAQTKAAEAEQETEKAYKQIDILKRTHEKEISSLKHLLEESRLPREGLKPVCDENNDMAGFYNVEGELSKLAEPPSSWFSGYDRCNI